MFLLLSTVLSIGLAPQHVAAETAALPCAAVEVRGDAELSPAGALASAERRAEQHVRRVWRERAEREAALRSHSWVPDLLIEREIDRWLADLPVERLLVHVDRTDRERVHEFGRSYQTTLRVAEVSASAERARRGLRAALGRVERVAAWKAGVVAVGWFLLGVALTWLDRLSRGYMTGRLRALGALGAASLPAVLFLV